MMAYFLVVFSSFFISSTHARPVNLVVEREQSVSLLGRPCFEFLESRHEAHTYPVAKCA